MTKTNLPANQRALRPAMAGLRVSALLMAFAALAAHGATPVYLKAGATGLCNGSSWNDAFTDVASAVDAAVAGDGLIYAAQGVYTFTRNFTVTTPLSIYGGFEGASTAETVAGRDTAAHKTIFSGDKTGDDYWCHYVTNSSYSVTTSNMTGYPVIGPNGVNLPPDFTDDYDGYRVTKPTVSADCNGAFLFRAKAVLDGLTFASFRSTGYPRDTELGSVVGIRGGADSVVNDCTFIANWVSYGAVYSSSFMTVSNCRFLYNWSSGRSSGVVTHGGTPIVSNCVFMCCSRTGGDSANVISGWGGGLRLYDCVFTRCLLAAGSAFDTNYNGPGNIYAAENGAFTSFTRCVVSNCYTASASTSRCLPLANTGGSPVHWDRCHFADNLQCVKPSAGKCYSMFTASVSADKKMSFEGCSFERNAITAPQVAATSGDYVLSIVGNAVSGGRYSLLNCSFTENRAEAAEVAGVTPILCRGVATACLSAGTLNQAGMAHCAFSGPDDGLYSFVQYGENQSSPANIVNCVFIADGEGQPEFIYADKPSSVHLYDTTLQNNISTSGDLDYAEGHQYDKIPLIRTAASSPAGRIVLVPAARTPGIRETCDVATNSANGTSVCSWNFRAAADGASWQALASGIQALSGSGFDSKLVGDAFGAARTSGAFTRGPSQGLSAVAETGASLVLRRTPFAAGSFDAESAQAVQKGSVPASVTTAPSSPDYAFSGWYDENGDLFSASATLSIASLTDDTTILTAVYSAPSVTLTFDLDGHGVFTANGSGAISVSAPRGDVFPEIPAFTENDGWHFVSFATPAYVPQSATTYHARFVTKDVRVFRVVPQGEVPEGSDLSGDSWANATDDVGAMLAEAALWRGEIWMKTGIYRFSSTPIRSNVAFIGGFAGTETTAAGANPAASPTIISGDVNGNDFWQPNGSDPGSAYRTNIWNGTVFNPPNPFGTDNFWRCTGNNGDNVQYGFCSAGEATNAVFSGLTFTGFKDAAIFTPASTPSSITVRDCIFAACGSGQAPDSIPHGGGVTSFGGPASISNCTFVGCWPAAALTCSSADGENVVSDCVFTENYGSSFMASLRIAGTATQTVERCVFESNCSSGQSWRNTAGINKASTGVTYVRDCLFAGNRIRGDAHGSFTTTGGGHTEIDRCRFIANDLYPTGGSQYSSAGIYHNTSGDLLVRDTLFRGNAVTVTGTLNSRAWSSAATIAVEYATFVNCTFDGNAATNASTGASVSVGTIGLTSKAGFANCLFTGSLLDTGTAEICLYGSSGLAGLTLVNTVAAAGGPGYAPLLTSGAISSIGLSNCAIDGINTNDFTAGNNGFIREVASAAPALRALRESGGVWARGVAAGSASVKAGRPVWLAPDNLVYIHDPAANSSKPWRQIRNRSSYASSVSGLSLESPLVPDAFGAARTAGKITLGPLNAPPAATFVVVE